MVVLSQEYPGSVDRTTPETRLLGTPISAQYVRVLPLEWNGQAGLRLDILGCLPDCELNRSLIQKMNCCFGSSLKLK